MPIIYQFSLFLYHIALLLAAPFVPKAKLFIQGRKNLMSLIVKAMATEHRPVAWFHCASLGEFEQGRPVIEEFRRQMPHYAIVVTFFSPSGYEVRKNYAQADYVWYLPLDTQHHAKAFIEAVKPKIAFFVKYEFWYFFLKELRQKGIPVISFSAIFRGTQPFFKWWGSLHRSMLHCFVHLFVQQEESKALLKNIGVNHVSVCADTRFDRVQAIAQQAKDIDIAAQFVSNASHVWVLGSAWKSDIEVLAPVLLQHTSIKIIIAPHEIGESNLAAMEQMLQGRKILRYSQAQGQQVADFDLLMIDNIGMLSSLYRYAHIAYIGGGFEKGLHNTLEAAVYGIPLIIGPRYEKFQEAVDMVLLGAAFSVKSDREAGQILQQFLRNEANRIQAGRVAKNYVAQHLGGTSKILNFSKKYLKE